MTRQHPLEDRDRIYRALCQTLAGQPHHVDWPAFSLSDWDLLLATARTEGVAPLLYHTLNGAGWPAQMPAHLRRDLQTAYYATAAHNLLLYHELTRILQAIDNWQLTIHNPAPSPVEGSQLKPPVVLKGAALAPTLYPTIALRPLADLDLLVPRRHLEPAVQVLRSLGYAEPHPESSIFQLCGQVGCWSRSARQRSKDCWLSPLCRPATRPSTLTSSSRSGQRMTSPSPRIS